MHLESQMEVYSQMLPAIIKRLQSMLYDVNDVCQITIATVVIIPITKITILKILALHECLPAASKSPLFHVVFT